MTTASAFIIPPAPPVSHQQAAEGYLPRWRVARRCVVRKLTTADDLIPRRTHPQDGDAALHLDLLSSLGNGFSYRVVYRIVLAPGRSGGCEPRKSSRAAVEPVA
jgi:hypothetical protein